ncbi:MAG: lysoplasmalogenase [Erysipelotrichaceae bacterium]|nr:lysoplasmalogenase [Erysipelotrichaceae bacterium]MBQ2583058.1 lysoplasmalogenase [Erysipelotrichaceae bacterium]
MVHLYASLKNDKKLRDLSKPFILLTLLGFYCFSVERISLTVVLALVFSWLGDVLLMPKGVKWFTAGGISFMISHFFFILSYLKSIDFTKVGILPIVCLAGFFFAVVTFIFSRLRPYLPKTLFYPMYLYLLINGAMNCFALFRYLSDPSLAGIVTAIGAALFFISDSTLFFVRFKKDGKLRTHFLVMFTYAIGEFLIVLGLILK